MEKKQYVPGQAHHRNKQEEREMDPYMQTV